MGPTPGETNKPWQCANTARAEDPIHENQLRKTKTESTQSVANPPRIRNRKPGRAEETAIHGASYVAIQLRSNPWS